MRLLLYIQGFTLLQTLFCVSSSPIQAHALAIPPPVSANPENKSTSLLPTKRAWPDHHHTFFVISSVLGLDWIIRFNVLEFVPQTIGSAPARDLVQFYSATLAVARAVWAHDEPRTVRRAAINGILLVFWSDQPISWDFLNSFFEHIVGERFLTLRFRVYPFEGLHHPSQDYHSFPLDPQFIIFQAVMRDPHILNPLPPTRLLLFLPPIVY